MIIDVEGVRVNVPDRWAKGYTEAQRLTVIRWVQQLKEKCGKSLDSVHVLRLVRRGDTNKYRIDGGYTNRPTCTMGFCSEPSTKKIKAFGNDKPVWWCDDHAELATINAATMAGEEEEERG